MKWIFLILMVLGLSGNALASHISGGELIYKYLGPGSFENTSKYRITMKLFRECTSNGQILNTETVNIGIYSQTTRYLYRDLLLNREWSGDPPVIRNTPSAFPCITGDKYICFEIGTFSATVDLPNTADGYLLSWIRFSRQELSNVNDDPYDNFHATGATFITNIPGTKLLGTGFNSSPEFVLKDSALVCAGKEFMLDFGAIDPDGDKLVYSFCAAYNGGSNDTPNPPPPNYLFLRELPYQSPYSGSSPLGQAVKIDPNTGIISGISPDVPGKYVVNVCVEERRNGVVINTHRKDFILKVAACDATEASLKPDYISCDGLTLTFNNESYSPAILSYYWEYNDGENIVSSEEPTPTFTFPKAGDYKIKLVVNKGQQCSDSTVTTAKVYPGFFPDFKVDGSCVTNPYQFTDLTTTNYGQVNGWNWDFGDLATLEDTANTKLSTYQYPAPDSATVRLIVTSTFGCIDTVYKTLYIYDKPLIALPFKDTLICITDQLTLGASSGQSASYSWLPNYNITGSGTANPVVFPKVPTYYSVTVNDRGCINTDSIFVDVTPDVKLSLTNDTTICLTDSIKPVVVSNGLRYFWTPDLDISDVNISSPDIYPTEEREYILKATVGGCEAERSIRIKPVPYPIANAGEPVSICYGKTVALMASTDAANFKWSPISSLLHENTLNPVAGPQVSTTYSLTVTDTKGCPKPVTDTVTVTVIPPVKAFAGNDTTIIYGQPLQLNASGGTHYTWSPTTGMDDPNIANPIINLNAGISSITYKLKVTTDEGCVGYDDLTVRIFNTKPEIFIPSGFTPNGDGLNDILKPVIAGMKEFKYFKVFNRYGQLLFSTAEQNVGWDGTFQGKLQSSGTYVFTAEAIDYLGNRYLKKGTVVLIR